jgi:hypothetical protein
MNAFNVAMSNVIPMRHARAKLRAVFALLAAVPSVVLPVSTALAAEAAEDSAESLVLIRLLTGPDADALQVTVEAAVAEYFSAVSASPAEETELAKGPTAMVAMSREKKYRAYVTGVVKVGPKGRTLLLTVYSGKDGKPVGEARFPGVNKKVLETKVDSQAGKVLAALLKKTSVAADGTSATAGAVSEGKSKDGKEVVTLEAEPEETAAPEEAEEEATPEVRPSPLDVHAGVGFMNLALSYTEPVYDSYGFELQPRPSTPMTVRVGGNLYPAALVVGNALADIGISGRFYQSFAGSIGVNGTPFDLMFREVDLGLRGRVRLDGLELGFGIGWGKMWAIVEGDNETFANRPEMGKDPGLFPDMQYTYIRVGADLRANVAGPFSVLTGFSVRLPSLGEKSGQIGEQRWFPRAAAAGVDMELGLLYEFMPGLSATLGVDGRIYGLTMHSNSGDIGVSAIAGGAQDRYLGGFAGVDYRF